MINISIDFPSSDKITSPEILKVDVNERDSNFYQENFQNVN